MNDLRPIASGKRQGEDGALYAVTLYMDVPDILKWLGGKAIKSRGKKSRALSGAIIARARKVVK